MVCKVWKEWRFTCILGVFLAVFLLRTIGEGCVHNVNFGGGGAGGLKVRQSYLSYKDCHQYVAKVMQGKKGKDSKADGKDEKKRKIPRMPSWQKMGHSKESLSKEIESVGETEIELNADFISGVYLGYGAFNLLLSLLPPRALNLLEFIGFSGDREAGLDQLTQAGASNTLRSPLCNLALLAYNFFIVYVMCLSEKPDMGLSNTILDDALKRYPQGAIYAFYAGRRHLIQGDMDKAIAEYQRSVSAQSDWVQLHHICYWELMHAHSAQGNWRDAAKFAKKLVTDSKWSKAIYQYLEAAYTYMAIHHDSDHTPTTQELTDLAKLFAAVAPFKQRIAGKSIPMEKFVIRKSRKFDMQGQYLMLPALEMMYAWSVFQYMQTEHLQAMLLMVLDAIADIQREFEEASARQDAESTSSSKKKKAKDKPSGMRHENITDDLCLGYLLKGHVEMLLSKYDAAEKSLHEVLSNEAGISLDHWLAPFARVELALLYRKTNRPKQAKEQLQTAMTAYKGYSMENRLHFRIHSGLMELGGYKD
eukprot:comp22566_c0_seq4/m.34393 comp22566_c0_seq4/g.34393  ORF comp22566_c0_seq4/g.34393 comp22566_c0_seq4/m.34393 type:complete len:532 (-) comp22566_c0_seq4:63-1658(-)